VLDGADHGLDGLLYLAACGFLQRTCVPSAVTTGLHSTL
jgi:hypothetical protein